MGSKILIIGKQVIYRIVTYVNIEWGFSWGIKNVQFTSSAINIKYYRNSLDLLKRKSASEVDGSEVLENV